MSAALSADADVAEPGPAGKLAVLELGEDAAVPFVGRTFVDFGAAVVKAELGAGDIARTRPPVIEVDGVRAGALFHSLNAGKSSVHWNLDADTGDLDEPSRAALDSAWRWADVVLIGVGFLDLASVAAKLGTPGPSVVTYVSPFGRSGTRKSSPATSATVYAMAGESSMLPGGLGHQMFPDAPPLTARGKVADLDAGVIASGAAFAALAGADDRRESAIVIDISVQEAELSLNRWIVSHYDHSGWIESRSTRSYPYAGLLRCADGFAMLQPSTDTQWAGLVEMMGRPEWATSEDLKTRDGRGRRGAEVRENLQRWLLTMSKQELLTLGIKYGVPIAPFRDPHEVLSCDQLGSRGFFLPYGSGDGVVAGLPAGRVFEGTAHLPVPVAPALGDNDGRARFDCEEQA